MPTTPRRPRPARRSRPARRPAPTDAASLVRRLVRDEFRRCVMRAAAEVEKQRAARRSARRRSRRG